MGPDFPRPSATESSVSTLPQYLQDARQRGREKAARELHYGRELGGALSDAIEAERAFATVDSPEKYVLSLIEARRNFFKQLWISCSPAEWSGIEPGPEAAAYFTSIEAQAIMDYARCITELQPTDVKPHSTSKRTLEGGE